MTTSMKQPGFWLLMVASTLFLITGLAVQRSGAAEPTAAAGAGRSVDIRNFAFHPGTLRVNHGARVTFTNSSDVTHTATKGSSFDTKRIAPGGSKAVQFNRRGTFAYHCKIHPFMKGRIVVE